MAEKKVVDVELLKARVTDKARSVLDGAKEKVQEVIEVKIDKSIAMLQKARKNLK